MADLITEARSNVYTNEIEILLYDIYVRLRIISEFFNHIESFLG